MSRVNAEAEMMTLRDLLSRHRVEIPRIQRDYAQGRARVEAGVRKPFVAALASALEPTGKRLDLGFVYGKVVGDVFIPVDGQQRLTTLFLLHILLIPSEDEEWTLLLQRFTYETRVTSRHFVHALAENRGLFLHEKKPSELIRNETWYSPTWDYDPTISGMIVMLDALHEGLSLGDISAEERTIYVERLCAGSRISFHFLNVEQIGSPDNLYLRLNARGRQLTTFENEKARMVATCPGRITLNATQAPQQCSIEGTAFLSRLEGRWSDWIWQKSREMAVEYDDAFLRLVSLVRSFFTPDTRQWPVEFYGALTEAFEYLLDPQTEKSNGKAKQKRDVKPEMEELVKKILKGSDTQADRIIFHALITYLCASAGYENRFAYLSRWLRIFTNLAKNTDYKNTEEVAKAMTQIHDLRGHWSDLEEYLSRDDQKIRVAHFNQSQVREEIAKLRLMLGDIDGDEWRSTIEEAEAHPYFSGQIRAILPQHAEADLGEAERRKEVERVRDRTKKLGLLFDRTGALYPHELRRVVLAHKKEQSRLAVDEQGIGQTYSLASRGHHHPGFKFFFNHEAMDGVLREILDDLALADLQADPETSLGKYVARCLSEQPIAQNDWRYAFVTYSTFFREMEPQAYASWYLHDFEQVGLLLLSTRSSSGKNWQIPLLTVEQALKERLGNVVDEHWVKKRDAILASLRNEGGRGRTERHNRRVYFAAFDQDGRECQQLEGIEVRFVRRGDGSGEGESFSWFFEIFGVDGEEASPRLLSYDDEDVIDQVTLTLLDEIACRLELPKIGE